MAISISFMRSEKIDQHALKGGKCYCKIEEKSNRVLGNILERNEKLRFNQMTDAH